RIFLYADATLSSLLLHQGLQASRAVQDRRALVRRRRQRAENLRPVLRGVPGEMAVARPRKPQGMQVDPRRDAGAAGHLSVAARPARSGFATAAGIGRAPAAGGARDEAIAKCLSQRLFPAGAPNDKAI